MTSLGLFPLPLALLPTERVPLHVFEPRYRELIGECIEQDGPFGIVLEQEGVRSAVGTRATVTDVLERYEDGRLDVLIRGGERFRLVGTADERSFTTGHVEPYADADDPADAGTVARANALFADLVRAANAEIEGPDGSAPLSFELAARVELATAPKQELLESQSERERLDRVCTLLEGAIEAVEREREYRDRAASNGKVPHQ